MYEVLVQENQPLCVSLSCSLSWKEDLFGSDVMLDPNMAPPLLYIVTTTVVAACISCIVSAASTDFASPFVPTDLPLDHLNADNLTASHDQDDVTFLDGATTAEVVPNDFVQSDEPLPLARTTELATGFPSEYQEQESPVQSTFSPVSTSDLTRKTIHRTSISPEDRDTVEDVGSTLRTPMNSATMTTRESGESQDAPLISNTSLVGHVMSTSASLISTTRRRSNPGKMISSTSRTSPGNTKRSRPSGVHRKTGHHGPPRNHDDDALAREANINHAALWITVAFVIVLLVYIITLVIYNAKRKDWHQSLPPYSRFLEEASDDESMSNGTINKMLKRFSGQKEREDGYALTF